jgi:hypothetical protein
MRRLVFGAAFATLLASQAGAVTFGEVDDFEDGTVEGWVVNLLGLGGSHPAPPQNVSTGGPAGTDDNYMLLTSVGGSGAGNRMTVINGTQWSGDYLSAGVTQISMDLKNFGDTELDLRLLFEKVGGGGPTDVATTTGSFTLAAGSDWTHVTFDITAADLTALAGTAENALSSATVIRLFHNPDPAFPGPAIVASLGVDNIEAVPEPATMAVLGLGAALMMRRRKRA